MLNIVFEFGWMLRPSFMCNMESKENTDEDVKRNFFFFSSLLRSEIPSVYFSSSSSSSSFFCRPEKVVTLFFSLLFLNYLASYPSLYSIYRVKFLFSRDERQRWEILLSSFFLSVRKKRGCGDSLTLIPIGQFVFFILLALFFFFS
jgi:hypothetical protein